MTRDKYQFDLAIIGGGLAGLCLAIQSVTAGYQTLLIEKETYPFHKVCGEYISKESEPFLNGLGLPLSEWALPSINQLGISAPNGKMHYFSLPLGGIGVSRYFLDNQLYQLAINKGVDILTGTKVQNIVFEDNHFVIETDNTVFTATLAAGSFGKKSNLDLKLNRPFVKNKPSAWNNYVGVKYHIQYPHPENLIELHNFKNGYCGISQIEARNACLCYMTTAENLQQNGNTIGKLEENVLWKNPLLKTIFKNATFLYEKPLTISQISFQHKKRVEDHLLFIGDAAGMIPPLCGNGMSMAMHGSKLAFENIHQYFQNHQDRNLLESNFEKQWNQHFSLRLQTGKLVQRFFGNESVTKNFLNTMSQFPSLAKMVITATHGKPF
ncbi:MAG TPA: FAD-binding protein [Sediminibacterium sp.]|jgi:flavin-dependent dehydrogenase|nr:FAD-binding protein [Sediminibacterium sp.]